MIEKQFKLFVEKNYGVQKVDGEVIFDSMISMAEADVLVDLLNDLTEENEELKKTLGAILLEVKRDISIRNQTGEIKVFINPNKFELISEVLKKYGALKEWYE